MTTKPFISKNPFSLIQQKPDNWQGLKGNNNGFLIFDNFTNGVRAGYINLYNAYFKKGLNTLNSIIPKYSGDDNAREYIDFISTKMKIKPTDPIGIDQIRALGLYIMMFETGISAFNKIPTREIDQGYNLASAVTNLNKFAPITNDPIDLADPALTGTFFFDNSLIIGVLEKSKKIALAVAGFLTVLIYRLGSIRKLTSFEFWQLARDQKLIYPLAKQRFVSSRFGNRTIFGKTQFHNGIDIPAPVGTPILAPISGTITKNFYNSVGGFQIVLENGSVRFGFAHLNKKSPIAVGDQVSAGQVIGEVGNTGRSTGAHLHFTVTVDGELKNPAEVFSQYEL